MGFPDLSVIFHKNIILNFITLRYTKKRLLWRVDVVLAQIYPSPGGIPQLLRTSHCVLTKNENLRENRASGQYLRNPARYILE